MIETHERVPSTERVAVRVVDSDVHPVPRPAESAFKSRSCIRPGLIHRRLVMKAIANPWRLRQPAETRLP